MYFKTIVLLSVFIVLSGISKSHASEQDVIQSMDQIEKKIEWLDYKIASEEWNLYTTGHSDSLDFYRQLYNYTLSEPSTIKQIKEGASVLSNESDLRRLSLLSKLIIERSKIDAEIDQLKDSLSALEINYRPQLNGDETTTVELYKIYRSDSNPSVRESAYRAYVSVGELKADGILKLVKLRNQKASQEGYNNYFTYAFDKMNIDINWYEEFLKKLDKISEKRYEEILNSLKSRLNKTNIEIWDLGYASSNVDLAVDNYFPVDSQLVYIKRTLDKIGFNIEKYPIYFDLDTKQGKSQYAYAFPIKIPIDIRVLANQSNGFNSCKVLFHEIGHALHFASIKQKNSLFRNMIDGTWLEGIAQTFAAMMLDPVWLSKYAHLPDLLIEQFESTKEEQDIIYLRSNLLRLNFEYEIYKNPNQDINKLYWDLFEKYMKLPRHDDLYPWASEIYYATHPVYLQNYLLADIIAAQNISYIKENFGSFIDNEMTRSFLIQNYLRFGARYSWQNLLKRGTDQNLQPDYFLRNLGLIQ